MKSRYSFEISEAETSGRNGMDKTTFGRKKSGMHQKTGRTSQSDTSEEYSKAKAETEFRGTIERKCTVSISRQPKSPRSTDAFLVKPNADDEMKPD